MQKGIERRDPQVYRPLAAEIASARKKAAELSFRRSELHRRKDIAGAIPLQLEMIHLLEQYGASAEQRAGGHNYLSVLYSKSGDLAKAELNARLAIELHPGGDTLRDHGAIACYFMMLARILALQERRSEAIPFAEAAIKEWNIAHNPPDDFLRAMQDELQSLLDGRWKNPL